MPEEPFKQHGDVSVRCQKPKNGSTIYQFKKGSALSGKIQNTVETTETSIMKTHIEASEIKVGKRAENQNNVEEKVTCANSQEELKAPQIPPDWTKSSRRGSWAPIESRRSIASPRSSQITLAIRSRSCRRWILK